MKKDKFNAVMFTIIAFLIGALMVQVGKRMDAEVELQRQQQMTEIANDELVNKEVTKK